MKFIFPGFAISFSYVLTNQRVWLRKNHFKQTRDWDVLATHFIY